MTEIVLRVRLIGGEHLDVTYEEAGGTPDEVADQVISTLAEGSGSTGYGQSLINLANGAMIRTFRGAKSTTTAVSPSTRMTRPSPYLSWVTRSCSAYRSTGGGSGGGLKGLEGR
jgi:hypothetical protein